MKLTWFGGTVLRLHIGGAILVCDAALAPEGVDRGELVAGADRVFGMAVPEVARIDPAGWRPRVVRPLDTEPMPVLVHGIGPGAVLIDAPGEPPLVVLATGAAPPRFGRWADSAVVVLCGAGEALVALGSVLLDVARPKLIALAADEQSIDLAIAELREHLDGAGLVSLEPGLAVEA